MTVFLRISNESVPPQLQILINEIALKDKRTNVEKYSRKCTAICHSLMSITRPRTFISPLQVGLGAMLHKKFASKRIIDILSNIGTCASYREVILYQDSALVAGLLQLKDGVFSEFIYDNGDIQRRTIDGKNTFHSMGGIMTVTPENCYKSKEKILRLKANLSMREILDKVEKIPFIFYEKLNQQNFTDVVKILQIPTCNHKNFPNCDVMWMFGTLQASVPGWNAFMSNVTQNMPYKTSKIICLSFLNASPSDRSTIYSVLKYSKIKAWSNFEPCKLCIDVYKRQLFMPL